VQWSDLPLISTTHGQEQLLIKPSAEPCESTFEVLGSSFLVLDHTHRAKACGTDSNIVFELTTEVCCTGTQTFLKQ
jgi:hypothetical protein